MTLLDPTLFHIHVLLGLNIIGEEHGILHDICCCLHDNDLEQSVAKAAWNLCADKAHGLVRSAAQ
jgi:hypothetical protein